MKLYLVRHGESSPSDPNQALSERGIEETKGVANLLKMASIKIDALLHSPKIRAQQTAEIFGNALFAGGILTQKEELKPNDPISPFLKEMDTFGRHVMVVSHLPFMEKLLAFLLFGKECACPFILCNSCVVCLEHQGAYWQTAWLATPELTNRSFT